MQSYRANMDFCKYTFTGMVCVGVGGCDCMPYMPKAIIKISHHCSMASHNTLFSPFSATLSWPQPGKYLCCQQCELVNEFYPWFLGFEPKSWIGPFTYILTNLKFSRIIERWFIFKNQKQSIVSFFSCISVACLVPQEADSERLDRTLSVGWPYRVFPTGIGWLGLYPHSSRSQDGPDPRRGAWPWGKWLSDSDNLQKETLQREPNASLKSPIPSAAVEISDLVPQRDS